MKVYRGPSTKPLSDEQHELVSKVDISEVVSLWHDSLVIRVNVTKELAERQAVAHIVLEAADVLKLHSTLIQGLQARSDALRDAERRLHNTELRLHDIAGVIGEVPYEFTEEWGDKLLAATGAASQARYPNGDGPVA